MKKIIKNITLIILMLSTTLVFWGCSDDNAGNMAFSGEVKILSFKANDIEATIDDASQKIDLFLPWSYNISSLNTKITLSEGAVVNPGEGSGVDLFKSVSYMVTSGNLCNTYTVTASHSKILTFSLGKYVGLIDNEKGTITVKYPKGEPVNSIFTTYTVSSGAAVSLASEARYDYTNPVTFTLSHLGETFDYVVTVVPTNFTPLAFLGTALRANAIENEDEIAAYKWFSENIPNSEYISFADIRDDKIDLNKYSVIWWHHDTDVLELPAIALSSTVTAALKNYYNAGGSFFLSSWATQYVAILEISLNKKGVNNLWGEHNKPFVTGSDAGICFTGQESHPIFIGLQLISGAKDKAYLSGAGVKTKGHNAIWSFDTWTEYPNNSAKWATETGAVNLASFHDHTLLQRSVLFEHPKSGTKGGAICIGTESYDWYKEDGSIANVYKRNIEILTSNIFSYLSE